MWSRHISTLPAPPQHPAALEAAAHPAPSSTRQPSRLRLARHRPAPGSPRYCSSPGAAQHQAALVAAARPAPLSTRKPLWLQIAWRRSAPDNPCRCSSPGTAQHQAALGRQALVAAARLHVACLNLISPREPGFEVPTPAIHCSEKLAQNKRKISVGTHNLIILQQITINFIFLQVLLSIK